MAPPRCRAAARVWTATVAMSQPRRTMRAMDATTDPDAVQRCSTCGELKPVEEFYFRNKERTLRQWNCKTCKSRYNRSWYERNRGKQLEDVKRARWQRKQIAESFVNAAKDVPCADCGGRFPSVAMDFDHVRGEKHANVSLLVNAGASVERLEAEIAKCDVVCSNCHRVRTQQRVREEVRRRREVEGRPAWMRDVPPAGFEPATHGLGNRSSLP